jgi:hypothetical protein
MIVAAAINGGGAMTPAVSRAWVNVRSPRQCVSARLVRASSQAPSHSVSAALTASGRSMVDKCPQAGASFAPLVRRLTDE